MEYTAVIRTLGTAGDKYQQLLNSLVSQILPPKEIIVYIAEGYPLPKETVGKERYVYVKKGMVAQRALAYDEVTTEYILFLDDDLYLPPKLVNTLYRQLLENNADVIAPDVCPNATRGLISELLMTLSGRMRARRHDDVWGYKVMRTAGYSYNAAPLKETYLSQTNAGACFFCKKSDFLQIHFEEELWLDNLGYPLGEDQIMYYKMYIHGLKQLTSYNTGIIHLDAGGNMTLEKSQMRIYSDFRFKTIFWHRFICLPEQGILLRLWNLLCIGYALGFTLLISLVKGQLNLFRLKKKAISDAVTFIKSPTYKALPKVFKQQGNNNGK